MARSFTDIYNALIAEKQSQSTLNGLQPNIDDAQTLLQDVTSPSKVADWRLWLCVVAAAIMVHEQLWDVAKSLLQDIADRAVPGTARWYQEQCFKFQLGYPLMWINGTYQYGTIDESAKIIKRAAVTEAAGTVVIKAAKLQGSTVVWLDYPNPQSVTGPEYIAFKQYINDIKYAGVATIIISSNPDKLKVGYKIYYDPLVLKSNGESLTEPGVFPVEDAINNYITNLPFNGELMLSKLTDAVQAVSGVADAVIQVAEYQYGANPYTAIVDSYNSYAGYMNIDPAFPLNTMINYIPNV